MNVDIMLDAGHYGKYNRSPVVKSYYESNMNWSLHLLLQEELKKYGITADATREKQKDDLALIERGKKAKGYEMFLSLHSNGCDDEPVDRVEVYYPFNKPALKPFAQGLADEIATAMGVSFGKAKTKESKDYPGTEYYGVMRGAAKVKCPAYFIIEHSFHTNKKAAEWLSKEENLLILAKLEARYIAKYFGVDVDAIDEEKENGEAKMNCDDCPLMKEHLQKCESLKGDMNGDGKVNAVDYALLKKQILGK